MPTENRSSNTEMVSVPRVLTREMLNGVCMHPDLTRSLWSALLKNAPQPAPQPNTEPSSYPPCDYCGITTDDHPWHGSGMINGLENRHIHACDACRGRLPSPLSQPHPEPIAWMVGTAIWWTKEEAERDAAETGLPIVGLGPMAGAAPAQQQQGEPVAWFTDDQLTDKSATTWDLEVAERWRAKGWPVSALYTHTDPSDTRTTRQALEILKGEANDLRAQLAAIRELKLPHYLKLSDEMRAAGDDAEQRAREDQCYSVPVLKAVFFEAAIQRWLDDQEEALSASEDPPRETMGAADFVARYCRESNISEADFYQCQVPMPDAGSPYGWAAISNNPISIKAHVNLRMFSAPVEIDDQATFEAAYKRGELLCMDGPYDNPRKNQALAVWKARAALARKPS